MMTNRKLSVALFASAALNLFLMGAVVGSLLGERSAHRPAAIESRRGGPPLWAAGKVLSPEHREAYGLMLRDRAPGSAEDFRAARRLRAEAWRSVAADPPDAAATKAALARARQLDAAARGELEERVVDFAVSLPPSERAKLAEQLAKPPHRRERRREP